MLPDRYLKKRTREAHVNSPGSDGCLLLRDGGEPLRGDGLSSPLPAATASSSTTSLAVRKCQTCQLRSAKGRASAETQRKARGALVSHLWGRAKDAPGKEKGFATETARELRRPQASLCGHRGCEQKEIYSRVVIGSRTAQVSQASDSRPSGSGYDRGCASG